MYKKYTADYYIESIYTITSTFFNKKKITHLFVDLDNTLTGDEVRTQPHEFQKWLTDMQQEQITIIIVSNNKHAERVSDFLTDTEIEWYSNAKKQNGVLFTELLQNHSITGENVAVIGDRVLTDVVGGKRIGAHTILTKPITKDCHPLVKYVRFFEGFFKPTKILRGEDM